jgi:hypothetical protein
MEKESHDVTAASHMASDGTIPTPEDFDEQRQDLNPTVFPSFGGAVEHAIAVAATHVVTGERMEPPFVNWFSAERWQFFPAWRPQAC